jgi:hypothetical protein
MTAQEKAFDLVEKFKFETFESEVLNKIIIGDITVKFNHYKAKQCALIAVDEIISIVGRYSNYWQEVKHEINQL